MKQLRFLQYPIYGEFHVASFLEPELLYYYTLLNDDKHVFLSLLLRKLLHIKDLLISKQFCFPSKFSHKRMVHIILLISNGDFKPSTFINVET